MGKLVAGIGDFHGVGNHHEVAANVQTIAAAVKDALPNAQVKTNDVKGTVTAQLDSATAAQLNASLPKAPEEMRAQFGKLKAVVNGNELVISGGTISGMNADHSQSLKQAMGNGGDIAANDSAMVHLADMMKKIEQAGYSTYTANDKFAEHASGVKGVPAAVAATGRKR